MAYDLHGSWENVTGHNSPLFSHRFDKDKTLNVVCNYLFYIKNAFLFHSLKTKSGSCTPTLA